MCPGRARWASFRAASAVAVSYTHLSEIQNFLSSVGESEKRVRASGKAVSDEVVLSLSLIHI